MFKLREQIGRELKKKLVEKFIKRVPEEVEMFSREKLRGMREERRRKRGEVRKNGS